MRMRASSALFLGSLIALVSLGSSVHAQTNIATAPFAANLSLGSTGPEVLSLQQLLNRDPSTRIRDSGPGSPGKETGYFGSLTEAAVVRFQEKYASVVLAPAGLARGTGRVGLYTRNKLNGLSTPAANSTSPDPAHLPTATAASTTVPTNPNLKNLAVFLQTLDAVATKQGASAADIAKMKEQVIELAATTTNLRATFLKLAQNKTRQASVHTSLIGRILSTVDQTFTHLFTPEHAYAATGAPFGGALLYAIPCNGGVWNIALEPLPPFYPALLSYNSNSQAHLSYNIPLTEWLLGEYEPVPMAYCWIKVVPYPSEGLIMPTTGSSPL